MPSLLPENFWLPGSLPSPRNTEAAIQAVADRFGIRLPPLMVELFQTCPTSGKARLRYLEDFGTVIFEDDLDSCSHWTHQLYLIYLRDHGLIEENEWDFSGLFCFARDSFGEDAVCLDYRQCGGQGIPGVSIADWYGKVKPVTKSLEDFLGQLERTDYSDNYCLEPQAGEQLWTRLANEFSLEISRPFQGYFKRDNGVILISIHPSVDAETFEPFLDEPAECWILQCSPDESFRAEFRRRLDELGISWKVLFEAR